MMTSKVIVGVMIMIIMILMRVIQVMRALLIIVRVIDYLDSGNNVENKSGVDSKIRFSCCFVLSFYLDRYQHNEEDYMTDRVWES